MDSHGRTILFCFFFIFSTHALSGGPQDGRGVGWTEIAKFTTGTGSNEDTLKNNGFLELALTPFNAVTTSKATATTPYTAAPAAAIDISVCSQSNFYNVFGSQQVSDNGASLTYMLYTPTTDMEINIELSKYNLNQGYSTKMQIVAFPNANWITGASNSPKTPGDSSSLYKDTVYCHADVSDICANSTMPVSYVFHQGLSYIFQVYADVPPTSIPSGFFMRMNLAQQIWIEDFDSTAIGALPVGWYASINAVTAPTRTANSTWVVGDIDYLSSKNAKGYNNGVYLAKHMIPSGGVAEIQHFLGLNPTIPCVAGSPAPCFHIDETVTTSQIDLTALTTAEFQFSATLDNQLRTTQDQPDWLVSVDFSLDNGATWNVFIGDNFPLILTGQNTEVWLTYQFNADVLCGNMVNLRFKLNQNAATSRYFGIDKIRFITIPNHKQMCAVDFTCGSPICPLNQTTGPFGCSFTKVDGVCSDKFSNECTSSTCVGKVPGADATTGCQVTPQASLCKGNKTALPSCETAVCDVTLGCLYTTHDNLCQAGASACQDYYCDVNHNGCIYNSTIAPGGTAKNRNPDLICNDNAACTTDVCQDINYVSVAGDHLSGGCTHTVKTNYCDNNPQASTPYGNSTCMVSICDPWTLQATNPTDNKGPAGSGCYVKADVSLCSTSSECDTKTCDYTSGCAYTPHDNICQDKASQCVKAKCISQVGCNFDDVTSKLVSVCSDGYSCTEEVCVNDHDKSHSGCTSNPKNDRCSTGGVGSTFGNAQCVVSVCNPKKSGAGNAFNDATLKSGCYSEPRDNLCDDFNPDCESNTCDFSDGCKYQTNDATCQANVAPCVNAKCPHGKTSTCDYSDVTTKLNTTCTDRSDCQHATCSNSAPASDAAKGCSYTSDDDICQARTTQCVSAKCSRAGCSFADVTSKVKKGFCSDGFDCTADTCSAAGAAGSKGCVNTPVDSVCQTGLAACAQPLTTCSPANSNTGSQGCYIIEDDTQCTGDVDCSTKKCNNITGCTYKPNSDWCKNYYKLDCNTYQCMLSTYDSSQGTFNDWQAKNADGCVVKQNCDDGFDCTIDECTAASGCINTEDDSRCKQAKGCTQNKCKPSLPGHESDGCLYEVHCDDGIACTIDECVNTTAGRDKCLHTVDMSVCDDQVDCTYEFTCDVNALKFDGSIPSTTKTYDNIPGCIRIPMNEWCDDLNPCTIDICETTNSTMKGGCQHYPIDCDDGIPCTADTCNAATGECEHKDIVDFCNDDLICTVDKCDRQLGMCTNLPDDSKCNPFLLGDKCEDAYCRPSLASDSSGCLFLPTTRCNDGIACTVDTCDSATGLCGNEIDDTLCDDGNMCTDDSCDKDLGKCTNIPNSDKCTDDLPCTVDFCDCETGTCVHTPVDCSDEIACTVDSCDNAKGECTNTPDDTLCDDGVLCTTDYCDVKLGRCVNKRNDDYCQDPAVKADQSPLWICQPPLVLTVYSTPHIDGCVATVRDCDDGIPCTEDYADSNGVCQNDPIDSKCNDGSECNDNTCSRTLGCIAKPNDMKCDDGSKCTIDVCGCDGKCEHNKLYCNDEIACTTDQCDEVLGTCTHIPNNSSCDDSIDCTFDTCDGVRGCSNIPHDDFCTFEESECSFGKCVIGAGGCQYELHDELCDDRIQCTRDYCNGVHECAHDKQDGLCDDGVACTSDECTDDGCVYTTHDKWCDDGIDCTLNTCDKDGCHFTAQDNLCDDGLNCTIDSCDPEAGCVHTPDHSLCSDGISCTLDTCNKTLQKCLHEPIDLFCSDDFNCTKEICNPNATAPTSGCEITENTCSPRETLWIDTENAYAQIIEKRNTDGSASSMQFITMSEDGEGLAPRMELLSSGVTVLGGSSETVLGGVSGRAQVVVNYPLRLVPVDEGSLDPCNEIQRGTIRAVTVTSDCDASHPGRLCSDDVLMMCKLGDTYQWTKI